MTHGLDDSFDGALKEIVADMQIMYGLDAKSNYHVTVCSELDTETVFGGADAEYSFYALVEYITERMGLEKKEPRSVFAAVAATFLKKFEYTMDVARWLAIINALIVGRDAYERENGHGPVDNRGFVYEYMEFGAEYALANTY